MVNLLNPLEDCPVALARAELERDAIYTKFKAGGFSHYSVCSFAYISKSQVVDRINSACYADWKYSETRNPMRYLLEVSYTAPRRNAIANEMRDETLAYLNWGLNESVWSPCYVTKDPADVLERGAILNVFKQDANWLFGAAFIIRNIYEHPNIIRVWAALIPYMSGELAYMFAHMLYLDPDGKQFSLGSTLFHHCFLNNFNPGILDGYLNQKVFPHPDRETGIRIRYISPISRIFSPDPNYFEIDPFFPPKNIHIISQDGWFEDRTEGFRNTPEEILNYVKEFAKHNKCEALLLPHLKG